MPIKIGCSIWHSRNLSATVNKVKPFTKMWSIWISETNCNKLVQEERWKKFQVSRNSKGSNCGQLIRCLAQDLTPSSVAQKQCHAHVMWRARARPQWNWIFNFTNYLGFCVIFFPLEILTRIDSMHWWCGGGECIWWNVVKARPSL